MKLRNVSKLPVMVVDEHSGRGAVVDPGGETPELSELAAGELLSLKGVWEPATKHVRTSGQKKKES